MISLLLLLTLYMFSYFLLLTWLKLQSEHFWKILNWETDTHTHQRRQEVKVNMYLFDRTVWVTYHSLYFRIEGTPIAISGNRKSPVFIVHPFCCRTLPQTYQYWWFESHERVLSMCHLSFGYFFLLRIISISKDFFKKNETARINCGSEQTIDGFGGN